MEVFRWIWCKHITTDLNSRICNITYNESIPTISEWFEHMETHYTMLLFIGTTMTAIVMLLGILHLAFVIKFISNEQIRSNLYWLVFMGPVIALCGSLSMILPRSAIFLYAIALAYFMLCLFVLVCLMTTLNGSRKTMCDKLKAKGVQISIQVCPLGCCLFGVDKYESTEKNFQHFEWLVFQSPIVRVLLEILNIIVFMESYNQSSIFFKFSSLIGLISLLIGSWGSYIIIPLGASLLKQYRFLLLFRIVDISQLLWSIQKLIADLLFMFDPFGTYAYYDKNRDDYDFKTRLIPSSDAQFYISFLLCVEMLVASLLATWLFRPTECAFFDLFRHRNGQKEFSSSQSSVGQDPDQQQQQLNQNAGPSAKNPTSDEG